MLIGKSVIRSGKENMSILLMCSLLVIPHISENMKAKYPNPDHFSKYERYQGFNLMLQIEVTSACNSYKNNHRSEGIRVANARTKVIIFCKSRPFNWN